MGAETELKLVISGKDVAEFRQLSLLNSDTSQYEGKQQLVNHYYDTTDQQLHKQRVALRTRLTGDGHWLQTLKTRGNSVDGLSVRGEWEWPLRSSELDFTCLTTNVWPEPLQRIKPADLNVVLSTNFERESWLVTLASGAVIEIALDIGSIVAGDAQQPIREVELELKQGLVDDLKELADELMKFIHLVPCDLSKAERGYLLLNIGNGSEANE
ncbi:inorganic triphosphatase [Zooshikella ganghwensis]|uniref:CYTH domain-containing protein n=1 Tax=Zooshikella ganghwensis TaxID=202772 RepID=UPI00041F90AC|nr:CYTH domain-containing protein [Zooshikella ganghwensis]